MTTPLTARAVDDLGTLADHLLEQLDVAIERAFLLDGAQSATVLPMLHRYRPSLVAMRKRLAAVAEELEQTTMTGAPVTVGTAATPCDKPPVRDRWAGWKQVPGERALLHTGDPTALAGEGRQRLVDETLRQVNARLRAEQLCAVVDGRCYYSGEVRTFLIAHISKRIYAGDTPTSAAHLTVLAYKEGFPASPQG